MVDVAGDVTARTQPEDTRSGAYVARASGVEPAEVASALVLVSVTVSMSVAWRLYWGPKLAVVVTVVTVMTVEVEVVDCRTVEVVDAYSVVRGMV